MCRLQGLTNARRRPTFQMNRNEERGRASPFLPIAASTISTMTSPSSYQALPSHFHFQFLLPLFSTCSLASGLSMSSPQLGLTSSIVVYPFNNLPFATGPAATADMGVVDDHRVSNKKPMNFGQLSSTLVLRTIGFLIRVRISYIEP